jgi:hypothetical protein
MGQSGSKGPPDGAAPSGPQLQGPAARRGPEGKVGPWETTERDEDIEGWKIMISGHRGAFYVQDTHLKGMGKTLPEYIKWLRTLYPHREVSLDS